jgi:predicted ATP-binding protein involved in virulence
MKITSLDFPDTYDKFRDGLETITIDKLNKTVLIAGRNGSGKTRLLKRIKNALNCMPEAIEAAVLVKDLATYKSVLRDNPNYLDKNNLLNVNEIHTLCVWF